MTDEKGKNKVKRAEETRTPRPSLGMTAGGGGAGGGGSHPNRKLRGLDGAPSVVGVRAEGNAGPSASLGLTAVFGIWEARNAGPSDRPSDSLGMTVGWGWCGQGWLLRCVQSRPGWSGRFGDGVVPTGLGPFEWQRPPR